MTYKPPNYKVELLPKILVSFNMQSTFIFKVTVFKWGPKIIMKKMKKILIESMIYLTVGRVLLTLFEKIISFFISSSKFVTN